MDIAIKQKTSSLLQNLAEYRDENSKPIVIADDKYNIIEVNKEARDLLCDGNSDFKKVSWIDFCRTNRITECGSIGPKEKDEGYDIGFRTVKKGIHKEIKNVIQWDIIYFDHFYIMIGHVVKEEHQHSNNTNIGANDTQTIFNELSNSLVALVKDFHTERLIEAILRQIVNSLFEHANLKNNRFEYLALSPKSMRVLGIKSIKTVVGKTVDVLGLTKKYNNQIHEIDEEAYYKKNPMININGEPFIDSSGKITKLILNKIPLLNSEGEVIFLLTLSIDSNSMTDPFVVRRMYRMIYKSHRISHEKFLHHYNLEKFKNLETDSKITPREIDVIMYLTLHNNVKMVARDLKINESTVRQNVDSIKLKMGCVNKLEIVELFLSHVKKANAQLESPV